MNKGQKQSLKYGAIGNSILAAAIPMAIFFPSTAGIVFLIIALLSSAQGISNFITNLARSTTRGKKFGTIISPSKSSYLALAANMALTISMIALLYAVPGLGFVGGTFATYVLPVMLGVMALSSLVYGISFAANYKQKSIERLKCVDMPYSNDNSVLFQTIKQADKSLNLVYLIIRAKTDRIYFGKSDALQGIDDIQMSKSRKALFVFLSPYRSLIQVAQTLSNIPPMLFELTTNGIKYGVNSIKGSAINSEENSNTPQKTDSNISTVKKKIRSLSSQNQNSNS